ncbi:50S ribosomal protein L30 [Schleiferia thermophila]|uniref:Large ribosomal subunit protein uL30 n=1 Tax=Schleiferia thermophila TaxID=884107 RepID=A0A369A9S0_9FLAO|nr:50S ribosomal protein L30 [Schleiferia thermophila]KFD38349.1 50S ribosomal protein L30 [Schleiferia thermophila str. Yellowstone]RCX04837.1 large subunit ribosomal protein L30 [Schleiferia thermophila]
MEKIKVTKIRSTIKASKNQKLNMKALGLKRINSSNELELTPQIAGIIERVKHLVKVEKI